MFYENGYGVSRNYYEAKKWYVMSGQNGDQEARGAVKRINNLIKVNPEIYSKNKIDAESIDLFTDVRTITIKRSKELFQSYVAIRETQIDSNYLTEGKVVIDNEICSSHAAYNSYVNKGVFHVICRSGYKASGLLTPLALTFISTSLEFILGVLAFVYLSFSALPYPSIMTQFIFSGIFIYYS